MRKLYAEICYQLRYALPLWFCTILTNWWPENGVTLRVRGALFSVIIPNCGRNLLVGKDVTLLSIHRLTLGDDIYLAKGTWINAIGGVELSDEVVFGPYVVISSSKHGFRDGSVRFGGGHFARVKIGRGTWVAAHASVAAGVNVGSGNIIAANAVVTRDTPDNVVVGGVPAKVIGPRMDNPSVSLSKHDVA